MIRPELFTFLEEIKNNNNKEWFDENRERYKELREHFINYVSLLIHELGQLDPSVAYKDPKKTVFRINRDIRFSQDKSPYKTNMGAFITPGGKSAQNAGYYLHIEPGECMIAGGIYMPPSKELKLIRNEIFNNSAEFRRIIENKKFQETFGELYGEKLKTAPRDFPKDHPDIDLVRYKSYTVAKMVPDSFLTGPDSLNEVMEVYRVMKPLNDFLNHVLMG
jgi:uncharacterized protein (TIGR02453 family)